jgi:hypothetical protein
MAVVVVVVVAVEATATATATATVAMAMAMRCVPGTKAGGGGRRRKRRDGWPTEANKVGHGVAYGKKTRQDWLARLGSRASQNGHRRAEHVRGGESSAGPYEAGQA